MKANEVKPGHALSMDGNLYLVVATDHVKPGKGPAYVQCKLKSISTGSISEKRLRTADDVEQAILDRRVMQYLYSEPAGHVFMDNETFDQLTMPEELLGDAMKFLKPNTDVTVLVYKNNPITLELPNFVELAVAETTPQARGATATNQSKDATMETGLKTRVPPFIEIGEVLRISTEDGAYMSRV